MSPFRVVQSKWSHHTLPGTDLCIAPLTLQVWDRKVLGRAVPRGPWFSGQSVMGQWLDLVIFSSLNDPVTL